MVMSALVSKTKSKGPASLAVTQTIIKGLGTKRNGIGD